MNAKKIAEKLREIASFYGPDDGCTNAIYDALIAIANELDPPAKPLLADARVGDLCRLRNGGYTQIESVKGLGGKTWYDRTDRYTSYPDGRLFKGENNESDIIATEPLAEVGSAEWAWQMMKMGKDIIHCEYTHGNAKWRMTNGTARCCLAGMSADTKEKWLQNAIGNGWQLYAEPEPEPEFNVGDFVKYDIDTYLRVIEPSGAVYKDKTLCKTLLGEIVGDGYPYTSCLTKASPSEVIVKIGCLKGTVAHSSSSHFCLCAEDNWTMIAFDMLDTPTRELVESLLKAQGGAE